MPFKSQAQRRFLWAKHPDIAKEFSSKTSSIRDLPDRVGAMKRRVSKFKKPIGYR